MANNTTCKASNEAPVNLADSAMAALQEREALFRGMVEHSPDLIGILREGCLVYLNPAGVKLFGADHPDQMLNKSVTEFVHPDDLPLIRERMHRIQASARPNPTTELRFLRLDGSIIVIEGASAPAVFKGQPAIHIICREITERRKAETALRQEQAFVLALMENLPNSIYFKDRAGRFLRVNPAAAAFLGESDPAQVVGKTDEDYFVAERAAAFRVDEETIIRTGRPLANFEEKLVWPDGRESWVLTSKIPLRDGSGRIIGTCGIGIDITEHKRAEAEREKLEAQLRQAVKMESVGRLAGGVAHDFNNMLGVILGHTEMAMDQVNAALPLHSDLLEIHAAAQRSANLTRQLLAFSRKQTVEPKVLNLNETITAMLSMLRRLIGETTALVWEPKEDVWTVRIDPSQVDQIMANLCVNARDAMTGTGRITVTCSNAVLDEASCADLSGAVPGDYVAIEVIDTGCGMDKETLTHVFEPFFTTKEMGKGTGLGLATVYGIVKQNDGYITANSEPGLGATFKIYLPRHGERDRPVRMECVETHGSSNSKTILVVEDEPSLLGMATAMLTRQGYMVLAANGPNEAIRLAREHRGEIHLLLTDVVMPEMNGWDMAKALLELYPRLRRLFMSGYPSNVIAPDNLLEEGVQFISKPFTVQDLLSKVRKALGQRADRGG